MALSKIKTASTDFGTETGGFKIPVGTTAQRPAGETGTIRKNSTTAGLEWYDDSDWVELGFKNVPQNSQSEAYTLALTDSGKHIFHPEADNNARTFTIPANSSVAYPIGTAITFINRANTVTLAITTDTLRLADSTDTGSMTLAANGIATAIKITDTEWIISGVGLATA
jgi:hypothetical protein